LLTKEVDALGNVEQYEYYVDGLLKQITKADSTTSNYAYDLAGRMTDVEYSDGTKINYGYNEVGSTTTMVDKTGTTTYQYDDMQRLISTTDSNDKTVSYTYDILGRKASITTPDNITTNYTYDVMDRLSKVTQNEVIAEYEYDANSQLISNVRNDITTKYEYNELGQLTQLTTSDVNSKIQDFTYQYDAIGNIVEEVRTEQDNKNTRIYDYDSASQLIEFKDNDYIEKYTYDSVGNMLEKVVDDKATAYTYNEANQLVTETLQEKTIEYIYNQNGDLVEKSTGEKYTYDIQGNLTSIKGDKIDQSFTYNGNGNRLSKTANGETTYYVNDLNKPYEQVLQTYSNEGVIDTYTYGLQRIDSKGETNETYLYDGRGSVVGVVDNSNNFASYSYTAYGDLMPQSPQPKVFGYNAEATDFETGMQYLRARYYDTTISKFFQEDDYRGRFINPISMNRYAYAHNNPVMGIDPSGYAVKSSNKIMKRVRKHVGAVRPKLERPVARASTPPMRLIDGGNPDYWASEEYRNRKIRTPEEYYRDKANGNNGSDDNSNEELEGGMQTPNGVLYPNGTFIDNEGNTHYCGSDAYDSFDPNIEPIEPSFPDEFLKLYAEIKALRNRIADLRVTVRTNKEKISYLEAEIEKLERTVDQKYNPPTVLDVLIALGYSALTVGAVFIAGLAAYATEKVPALGAVLGAVLSIDAETWASTVDAWATVGYQTDEYKAAKKELKEKKGERNALEYENYEITRTNVVVYTDWVEKKGKIREANDELEYAETIIENKYPGMLDYYEKFLRSNVSTTIKPLN